MSSNLFPRLKFSSNKSEFTFQAKGKIKRYILTYKALLDKYFTVFHEQKYQRSQKNLRCVSFAFRLADENGAVSLVKLSFNNSKTYIHRTLSCKLLSNVEI